MIFIVGGAFSGKRDYARDHLGAADLAEGLESFDRLCEADAVCDFQLFAEKCVKNGLDAFAETERLIEKNPSVIIIADEIGCGVVPVEKSDRELRELCGRLNCMLAERADKVVRVVCGIGRVIK